MILLNAVYFDGLWKNQFKERSTKYRPFYTEMFTKAFVPTMSNIDSYFYGDLPDLKAKFIEIPYAVTHDFYLYILYILFYNHLMIFLNTICVNLCNYLCTNIHYMYKFVKIKYLSILLHINVRVLRFQC
jgi:serine protease inhibitor